jgi:stage II sporulation protein D
MLLRAAAIAAFALTVPVEGAVLEGLKNIFSQKAQVEPVTIRVLVARDEPGVMLETKGKYSIYNAATGDHISTRSSEKRKFVQTMRDGLKWGEELPFVHQILLVPEAPNGMGTTLVNGREYKGKIYVYNVNGFVYAVNEVQLEDYLASTLPIKFKKEMPEESLAAIVITERTKAYYQSMNPQSTYFAVDAEDVGYYGYAISCNKRPSCLDDVLALTKNMVMSRTAAYEGVVTPIPACWASEASKAKPVELARIDIQNVEEMAKEGQHAAQILGKAFPHTSIQVIQ